MHTERRKTAYRQWPSFFVNRKCLRKAVGSLAPTPCYRENLINAHWKFNRHHDSVETAVSKASLITLTVLCSAERTFEFETTFTSLMRILQECPRRLTEIKSTRLHNCQKLLGKAAFGAPTISDRRWRSEIVGAHFRRPCLKISAAPGVEIYLIVHPECTTELTRITRISCRRLYHGERASNK